LRPCESRERFKSRGYGSAGCPAGELAIFKATLLLRISAGPAAMLVVTLSPASVRSAAMLLPSFSYRTLALVVISVFAPGAAARFGATALKFRLCAFFLE